MRLGRALQMFGLSIARPLNAEVAWPTVHVTPATTHPSLTSTSSILSPALAIGLARPATSWSTPLAPSATPIVLSVSTQARPARVAPVDFISILSMLYACRVV